MVSTGGDVAAADLAVAATCGVAPGLLLGNCKESRLVTCPHHSVELDLVGLDYFET